MKVLSFKIPKSEKDALIYQEDTGVAFYEQLHQHEEIQISYIIKGSGTLIVGDSISVFNENDIIVIGENLPQVFRTDHGLSTDAEMLTLFFTKTSLGMDFFN
jgi:cupin superfamily acireductone dioxygenase involved in methionine salvage